MTELGGSLIPYPVLISHEWQRQHFDVMVFIYYGFEGIKILVA